MTTPHVWLVVPAAGIGQRMAAQRPKQYLTLDGWYLLDITLPRLLSHGKFSGCMVALAAGDPWWPQTRSAADPRITTCTGGSERVDSVLAALRALAQRAAPHDWVLVHDVARPCLHPEDLQRLLITLWDDKVGGILAAPVADTLKRADDQHRIDGTVDRRHLWRALTPQMFRYQTLVNALEQGMAAGVLITDEASAVEAMGAAPGLVEGRTDNIKVTVPADLTMAGYILRGQGFFVNEE
ncbi:MAG: 2-C-methyl-D-erythritol 4-phosphate cytidylyltransferase [Marinobacter sp.]|nr:2-C-methyl-D-erythritol 4-phosphate cytidylyltransferase [Marinobacter sp.]